MSLALGPWGASLSWTYDGSLGGYVEAPVTDDQADAETVAAAVVAWVGKVTQ